MELDSTENVIFKELRAKHLPLNKDIHGHLENAPNEMLVVFHTILLLHCILFFIKIIFELSLGINRFTNIFELSNLGCLFVLIVTIYTSIIIKNRYVIDLTDDKTFHNFELIYGLEDAINITYTICTFFFPFRIFQWLAHFSIFDPAKTVINTFVRTTPGMLVYAFLSILMVICFAVGIHISLGSMFMEFSTYNNTIVSIFCRDLQMIMGKE